MKNIENIKLRFSEPKFHIDETNKVVVCYLECKYNLPWLIDYMITDVAGKLIIHACNTKGVAKCSPNDTFNINKGKKIALARAEQLAYRKVSNRLIPCFAYIDRLEEVIDKFIDKATNVINHNNYYISSF